MTRDQNTRRGGKSRLSARAARLAPDRRGEREQLAPRRPPADPRRGARARTARPAGRRPRPPGDPARAGCASTNDEPRGRPVVEDLHLPGRAQPRHPLAGHRRTGRLARQAPSRSSTARASPARLAPGRLEHRGALGARARRGRARAAARSPRKKRMPKTSAAMTAGRARRHVPAAHGVPRRARQPASAEVLAVSSRKRSTRRLLVARAARPARARARRRARRKSSRQRSGSSGSG